MHGARGGPVDVVHHGAKDAGVHHPRLGALLSRSKVVPLHHKLLAYKYNYTYIILYFTCYIINDIIHNCTLLMLYTLFMTYIHHEV